MNNTYEVWVVTDSYNNVITAEYETAREALAEVLEYYTMDEAKENCFTVCRLLWYEGRGLKCLEEITDLEEIKTQSDGGPMAHR